MPHLQEAALQDWSFVSFKRVGEKPLQDRCEVANPAAFAEQLQWSRQFWESPHSGSYNQTKVWQPPPSEGGIVYAGGTLDIPRRAHVFSLWSTALEDINHNLVCVKGLLWVQCPRRVPAWCCSVASCSFLVATCHKKKRWKSEERERKLPVNGEETDRNISWNQPKAHLVWYFSAYTFIRAGNRQPWCYLKMGLLLFWEECLEMTLKVEPGMMYSDILSKAWNSFHSHLCDLFGTPKTLFWCIKKLKSAIYFSEYSFFPPQISLSYI